MKHRTYYLLTLFIVLVSTLKAQDQIVKDWYRAPLNPLTPLEELHFIAQGPIKGNILKINENWYDTTGFSLKSNVLDNLEIAKKYNGRYLIKNDKGQIIESKEFNSGKENSTTFTYNEQGLLIERNYQTDGKVKTYFYDSDNRLIKDVFTSSTFTYTSVYTYSNKGKSLVINEVSTNKDGVVVNEYNYTYRDGLLRQREEVGQESTSYTYEFDSNYNWITQYKEGQVINSKRDLFYHDQLQEPRVYKAIVQKGTYSPSLVVTVNDMKLQTHKGKNVHYAFDPSSNRYLKIPVSSSEINAANLGKTYDVMELPIGNNLLTIPSNYGKPHIYLRGVRMY